MAPRYYLDQHWLIIRVVPWHSPGSSFTRMLMNLICNMCLEITLLKLLPHLPGVNELMRHWGNNMWKLLKSFLSVFEIISTVQDNPAYFEDTILHTMISTCIWLQSLQCLTHWTSDKAKEIYRGHFQMHFHENKTCLLAFQKCLQVCKSVSS